MNEPAPLPVNLLDLLGRLSEPGEPVPVSLVPQTAGWVVLAIAAIALLCWAIWRWARRWHANAYRRSALAELDAAKEDPAAIAVIVRRTALAVWPRERVAGLTGKNWLQFLDDTGGKGGFVDGPGAALASAPYRPEPTLAVPGLDKLVRHWIRNHRVEPSGEETRS